MNIREGEKVRLRAVVPEDRAAFHANDQDTEGAAVRRGIFSPSFTNGCRHDEHLYGLLKDGFVF
ncbi:hypothetical protein I8J29_30695 [Paenibacillus sp. MWE-103]|uniref:N-acetyltransferase n=1 Tax=Paenibacillus artemisiicola TaxID=1172618 RepID=A0ABS3WJP6_9BACL|nr:hypothetical protein [Paenibacillus artemisiicola]MBO7748553.1 hypothetical protein [Paenibacillus artemisiicola]